MHQRKTAIIIRPLLTCFPLILQLTIGSVWLLSGLISAPRLYYITTMAITFPSHLPHAHENDHGVNGTARNSNVQEVVQQVVCAPTPTLYNSSSAEIIFFVLLFLSPLVVTSVLYTKIASIIWKSSAMLPVIQLRKTNNSSIPIVVRSITESPAVPHNSLATRSSASSTAQSDANTWLKQSQHGMTISVSKAEKLTTLLPPVEPIGPDYDSLVSCATYGRSEAGNESITDMVDNDLAPSSRKLLLMAVCKILRHPRRNNPATATNVTALGVKNARQGRVLKSRQSAIKMLIVIVTTFFFCNFPYYLRRICQYYVRSYDISGSFNQLLTPITFLLMYANCAVNPILYAFLSESFRSSFKDLWRLRLKRSYNNEDGR